MGVWDGGGISGLGGAGSGGKLLAGDTVSLEYSESIDGEHDRWLELVGCLSRSHSNTSGWLAKRGL